MIINGTRGRRGKPQNRGCVDIASAVSKDKGFESLTVRPKPQRSLALVATMSIREDVPVAGSKLVKAFT